MKTTIDKMEVRKGGKASKTRIIDQSVFQSVEDRDGMLQSGMEGGATELFDRLEEILNRKV